MNTAVASPIAAPIHSPIQRGHLLLLLSLLLRLLGHSHSKNSYAVGGILLRVVLVPIVCRPAIKR